MWALCKVLPTTLCTTSVSYAATRSPEHLLVLQMLRQAPLLRTAPHIHCPGRINSCWRQPA